MRFLFVSAQLPGHLDWGGFLDTAVALQQRGHKVLWATGAEVASILQQADISLHVMEQTGWRWPPPAPLQPDPKQSKAEVHQARAERALDQWLDIRRVGPAVEDLLHVCQTFRPDVIVAENFMSAAAIAAEVINVPFAVAGWPAFQAHTTPKTQTIAALARKRLDSLKKQFTVTGRNWTTVGAPALLSPWLHLSYWSPSWFDGVTLLEQTAHVGGQAQVVDSLPKDDPSAMLLNGELIDTALTDTASTDTALTDTALTDTALTDTALTDTESIMDAPWVFVTLGTSFANDPNFFIAATHAVEQVEAIPIVALGHTSVQKLRERLAPSSIVLEQINFGAVLPSISAAIHHGGAGTTHALVTHAVPQIVVPHAADQMHQAHGVARSEVGIGIRPQNVTIAALAQVLDHMLLETSNFQRNAQRLQAEFAQLGGIQRAADLLEQAAN